MKQEEWLKRYAARIVAVTRVPQDFADKSAQAVSFEELSEGFEDDPEGAADEEMSYWCE